MTSHSMSNGRKVDRYIDVCNQEKRERQLFCCAFRLFMAIMRWVGMVTHCLTLYIMHERAQGEVQIEELFHMDFNSEQKGKEVTLTPGGEGKYLYCTYKIR